MEKLVDRPRAKWKSVLIYGASVVLTVFVLFPIAFGGVYGVYVAAPLGKMGDTQLDRIN